MFSYVKRHISLFFMQIHFQSLKAKFDDFLHEAFSTASIYESIKFVSSYVNSWMFTYVKQYEGETVKMLREKLTKKNSLGENNHNKAGVTITQVTIKCWAKWFRVNKL